MRTLMTVAIAACVGCASNTAPSSQAEARVSASTSSAGSSSPRAPLTVEWVPLSEAAGRVTLVARINRNVPIAAPVVVSVTVPPGLRVVSGRTGWTIETSDSVAPVEETVVVDVVTGGRQELILAADVEGANFGVHAKRTYVIGQVAGTNAPQQAPAPGPRLEVGGHDFGPSVPAK